LSAFLRQKPNLVQRRQIVVQDFDGRGVAFLSALPASHGIAGEPTAQVAADSASNQLTQIRLSPVGWKFSAGLFGLLDLGMHADFGAGGVFCCGDHWCPRRLSIDPPCRSNIDPGPVAAF